MNVQGIVYDAETDADADAEAEAEAPKEPSRYRTRCQGIHNRCGRCSHHVGGAVMPWQRVLTGGG